MDKLALTKLFKEMQQHKPLTLTDLFKLKDACMILAQYGLEDKDLLSEVNQYIIQIGKGE